MCGRFVVAQVGSELVSVLRVDLQADDLPAPSYNIAPTSPVAIVLDSAKSTPPVRRLEVARWGLVPGWAKSAAIGARAFNARSEELEGKPMFRAAFQKRRAIVPATGYYEWKTTAAPDGSVQKIPHFIHPGDGSPLFMAGLYEWWKDPAKADAGPDDWLLSFTILTCAATGALAGIHERMPLIVEAGFADAWLDPAPGTAGDVLDAASDAMPALAAALAFHPVAKAVGNVRNNAPYLIDPVPAEG